MVGFISLVTFCKGNSVARSRDTRKLSNKNTFICIYPAYLYNRVRAFSGFPFTSGGRQAQVHTLAVCPGSFSRFSQVVYRYFFQGVQYYYPAPLHDNVWLSVVRGPCLAQGGVHYLILVKKGGA